jgi:hypothetical protein
LATLVNLTWYAILLPHFGKHFFGRIGAAGFDVFAALTDSFDDVSLGGDVEEALIGFGGLDNGLGSSVDGENDGAARLLELLEHLDGVVAEGGEGLDVLGYVDHGGLRLEVF